MSHWTNEQVGALVNTLHELVKSIEDHTGIYEFGRWRKEHEMVPIKLIESELAAANKKLEPFRNCTPKDWWKPKKGE
jgi:hypothetical protein